MRKKILKISNYLLLLIFLFSFKIVFAQETISNTSLGVDGSIYSILTTEEKAYLGGSFNYIGQIAGSGILVNKETGQILKNFPKVDGIIYTALPDGSNGFFIGGKFTKVNGQERRGLAHILSDGSVDPNFVFNIDFEELPSSQMCLNIFCLSKMQGVYALVKLNNILYVGGKFNSVNRIDRSNFFAIDLSNNQLTSLNLSFNKPIHTLCAFSSATSSRIYIGGEFNSINGQTRNYLVALDPSTGQIIDSFNPNPNDYVYSLFLNPNDGLYVAGRFTQISGLNRNFIAKLDPETGNLLDWNPNPNNTVFSLAIDNSNNVVYFGGAFSQVNGINRSFIAAVNLNNGSLLSFNPNLNSYPYSLLLEGNVLYLGGAFTSVNNYERFYLASISTRNGNLTSWVLNVNSPVWTLVSNQNDFLIAGEFKLVNAVKRRNLAEIDLTSDQVTSWQADTNNTVYSLAFNSDKSIIFVAGAFTNIKGISRNYLASLNRKTAELTNWQPIVNSTVNKIFYSPKNKVVYIAGNFSTVNGQERNYLASLEEASGNLTSFNPNPSYQVKTLILNEEKNIIIFGTEYQTWVCRGWPKPICYYENRSDLSAFDLTNNSLLWTLNANNFIKSLAFSEDGEKLYVGGDFTNLNNLSKNFIAKVDLKTGNLEDFNISINGGISSIFVDGKKIYLSGFFSSINSQERNYIGLISETAELKDWSPNFNNFAYAFAINKSLGKFLVGGSFTEVNNNLVSGLAIFNLPVVEFLNEFQANPYTIETPEIPLKINPLSAFTEEIKVNFKIIGGTALLDKDFQIIDQKITFSPSNLTFKWPIKILKPLTYKPERSIIISLDDTENSTLGEKKIFTYLIEAGGPIGVVPSEAYLPPHPPKEGFKVLINNGEEKTNSREVVLNLIAGPDVEKMVISNSFDFKDSVLEPYQKEKRWVLSEGYGLKTVYVKFYTPFGQSSPVISASIYYSPIEKPSVSKPTAEEKPSLEKKEEIKTPPTLKVEIPEILRKCDFDVNLGYGSTGEKVVCLQNFLKWQGKEIYPEGVVSGIFGPLTYKAVLRFQEKYSKEILQPLKLKTPTGFVGPYTRAQIEKLIKK